MAHVPARSHKIAFRERWVLTQRGTLHLAARAYSGNNAIGPLLSAEGCNLDDASGEFEHEIRHDSGQECRRCVAPLTHRE